MLTGDSKAVAERVGKVLGVDEVHAELLPENKVEEVERLLAAKSKKGKLLFVGDGINDAPVLARADVGVAMGGLGSDAAIEAADVVIMTDEPSKLLNLMDIADACHREAERHLRTGGQAAGAGALRGRPCQYVGCRIRGCRGIRSGDSERDAGAEDRAKIEERMQLTILSAARWSDVHGRSHEAFRIGAAPAASFALAAAPTALD